MTGTVIPLSEVPDEAFAGKMMGDGAAVIPDDEYVYAPADGTVTFVFPTKHAIQFVLRLDVHEICRRNAESVFQQQCHFRCQRTFTFYDIIQNGFLYASEFGQFALLHITSRQFVLNHLAHMSCLKWDCLIETKLSHNDVIFQLILFR